MRPNAWSADGKSLLFFSYAPGTATVSKIDLATRRIEKVKEIIMPPATYRTSIVVISRDQRTYAYTAFIDSSDLYLLDGVR